jgi:lysophospholipase L1-like esterase
MSVRRRLRRLILFPSACALVVIATFVTPGVASGHAESRSAHWIATWGASPQGAISGTLSAAGFNDQTVRDILVTSIGGNSVRVRFSNTFGRDPLDIGEAAIGVASERTGLVPTMSGPMSFGASSAVLARAGLIPDTNRQLFFGGRPSVLIPPGAEALSDPVDLRVLPLLDLAVSLFLPRATGPTTWHADAQQVNYVAEGQHALDPGASAFTKAVRSWYFLDRVDVSSTSHDLGTVVALGDSITDGYRSSDNENDRWPNYLARRLDTVRGPTLGVIDEGIGGNRVLTGSLGYGVSALDRFERDAIDQPGVRDVILLEGINDIGFSQESSRLTAPHTNVSANQIIAGYERLIVMAHAAGLRIFGGTVTPFEGSSYADAAGEAKREAVNHWILTSGAFDGVIDFAKALADPADPMKLNPAYDSGDHLHPNDAGYLAMANAVSLAMLGVCTPDSAAGGKRCADRST